MMIAPKIVQALTVSKALSFYAQHGKPINTAYTPKRMLRMAENLCGIQYGPREYQQAAADLKEWAWEQNLLNQQGAMKND